MGEDPYAGFAERYDLGFRPFGQPDVRVTEFFRRLFVQHGVRAVLDCACGTGQHLPLFHSLGCEVYGSDLSESMLAEARQNLASVGLAVPLRQADFRDLPGCFRHCFDAVVCLGAIGYMPDEAEILRAFRSMRGVLRDAGLLVLTAIPTDKQWQAKPRFSLTANNCDFSRIFVMDYGQRTVRYNILDVFHSATMNELKVWSAELSVVLRDDQERLLRAAGFDRADFYGTFEFEAYDKQLSDMLIVAARAAHASV